MKQPAQSRPPSSSRSIAQSVQVGLSVDDPRAGPTPRRRFFRPPLFDTQNPARSCGPGSCILNKQLATPTHPHNRHTQHDTHTTTHTHRLPRRTAQIHTSQLRRTRIRRKGSSLLASGKNCFLSFWPIRRLWKGTPYIETYLFSEPALNPQQLS
ncbi:hypothetical protein VTK73DRAFT_6926 [Phialemonium thermophilum]|uniref:Uncharacterized protein n=1 Tax=Phialemonium thermophilum TaxID=223376 RepID=A0ABR3WHA6_9PEZI